MDHSRHGDEAAKTARCQRGRSFDTSRRRRYHDAMRAARCARLSRNRQGLSTNTHVQLAECAQYVEGKGWTLGVTHGDDDLSASRYSTKPRPGYAALLADIAAGRVDVIVVTEMTCLYRRLEELLELIKLAETTALKRIETTDGMSYDLSTGEGVHQANHS